MRFANVGGGANAQMHVRLHAWLHDNWGPITPFYPQIKIKGVQIKIRGLQIKITRYQIKIRGHFNLKSFYFNLNSFYFNLRVKRCSCSACSNHGWECSARAHVHTALLYLRNGLADCVQMWCVGLWSLPKCFTRVMGEMNPHVGRGTGAPLFRILTMIDRLC